MTWWPPALVGLLEDASLSESGLSPRNLADTLAEYREHRASWWAALLGPIRVPDRRVAELGRVSGAETPLPVCVVNTSGAGGLLSLNTRPLPGIQLVAVESALRDLDDLAANAARVVAAAAELDESVEVYVEVPYAPGWEQAVSEVEAAGLCCSIRMADQPQPLAASQLATQLSVLIEADVGFKSVGSAVPVLALVAAVAALIEGTSTAEAASVLGAVDQQRAAEAVRTWGEPEATRVRRRLRLVSCPSLSSCLAALEAVGAISAA